VPGVSGYYDDKLAAARLRRVYELASPTVRQYLDAEVEYVRGRLEPGDVALELGCGYGRVLGALAARVGAAVAGGGICRITLFGFPCVKRVNKGSDSYAQGNPFRDSGR